MTRVIDERRPSARLNEDGSLDVWARTRWVRFPGGGRKPTVTDHAGPPADAVELPADVLVDLGDAVTMISHDGWYVRFTMSTVDINRTKARRASGRRVFYRFGR
jgi:hypothetical protein